MASLLRKGVVHLIDWPFKESSELAVQGWGFWLAIIGLIISVVGFWITIIQLSRTKKATEFAASEIKRIQFAIVKYEATVETSRAEAFLSSARKHVKFSEWSQAGESLEALTKALHTLIELRVLELSPHAESINSVLSHARRLCERLDKAFPHGLSDGEKQKTLSNLRDHDNVITSMRIALQRSNICE